jgi:hypothetical protein
MRRPTQHLLAFQLLQYLQRRAYAKGLTRIST